MPPPLSQIELMRHRNELTSTMQIASMSTHNEDIYKKIDINHGKRYIIFLKFEKQAYSFSI